MPQNKKSTLSSLAEPSRKPTLPLLGLCGPHLHLHRHRHLLLAVTGGDRFPQHRSPIFVRHWRRGAVRVTGCPGHLVGVVAPTAGADAVQDLIRHADRKRRGLVSRTLIEPDTIVVRWFRLPPRYGLHALDRAVVAAGRVGLIARGFRRGTAPGRSRDGFVGPMVVRDRILLGVLLSGGRAVLWFRGHPRDTPPAVLLRRPVAAIPRLLVVIGVPLPHPPQIWLTAVGVHGRGRATAIIAVMGKPTAVPIC